MEKVEVDQEENQRWMSPTDIARGSLADGLGVDDHAVVLKVLQPPKVLTGAGEGDVVEADPGDAVDALEHVVGDGGEGVVVQVQGGQVGHQGDQVGLWGGGQD